MKKIIGALIICTLIFSGCSANVSQNNNENVKKKSKIEVYSMQDKLLKTIDNQDTVNMMLETYNWDAIESLSDSLIPEFKLLVYQEKTLLYGQDPDKEREYELIETIITFQNSSYIKEVISSDVIKSMTIPESAMTTCYVMPDDIIEKLHELVND